MDIDVVPWFTRSKAEFLSGPRRVDKDTSRQHTGLPRILLLSLITMKFSRQTRFFVLVRKR